MRAHEIRQHGAPIRGGGQGALQAIDRARCFGGISFCQNRAAATRPLDLGGVERADRELAPRQSAAFVAVELGQPAGLLAQDEGELFCALRLDEDGVAHVLRQRDALLQEFARLGEQPDPGMEPLAGR
jgi:hypothetical protein